MIKAIIFDLDGTIISDNHIQDGLFYVYKNNITKLNNISIDTFIDANRNSINDVQKLRISGKIALHQVGIKIWYLTLKYLNIPLNSELIYSLYTDLQEYILDHIKIKPGFIELIKYLKSSHIKVGVLSNGLFLERFERLKKLGIIGYIDVLISSDMVGAEKPNKKMFQYILKTMNLPVENVMYIGNDPIQDIEGAKNAGLLTIVMFDEYRKDKTFPKNTQVITDFKDIIKIVDQTNI